jgi:glycosyltransferase involved in cell wall biosynthesis
MRGYVSAPLMRGDDESFSMLVAIIERSLNRVPQLGWILFGDAPDDAKSRERLNALMEEGGVEFLPGYENRHLAYHASDILLSTGLDSAQPWLMEMCATRAPVLGANSPRNRLCIRPGENGFLVEQDDLDGWIERIRFFIDRPEQRDVMGVRSRQLAMRLFDSQLMQRRLFRTWDAVMREQFESAEIKEQAEPAAANRKRDRDLLDEG